MAFEAGIKPTLYGVPQSPFVRKVRSFMHAKNLPFNIIPIMPGDSRKTFRRMSPFGKIPAYREGSLRLCDSSVICAYLEKCHPENALFPVDNRDYAQALWIEEYCDTVVSKIMTFRLMYQCFLKPAFRKIPPDVELIESTLRDDVPPILNHVEEYIIGTNQFLVGNQISIADISMTAHMLSYIYSGHTINEDKWPKTKQYIDRMLETDPFPKVLREENYPYYQVFLEKNWDIPDTV